MAYYILVLLLFFSWPEYSNANFEGDIDDRQSQNDYAYSISNIAIGWKCHH